MKTNRFIFILLLAASFAACDKNAVQEDQIFEPVAGSAQVKFFHFGVNAPGVNFFVGDDKVTAISSSTGSESVNGTNYTGAAAGALYTAHAPGQHTLSGRISAATDKNLAIASLPATLAADRHYSFYLSGFYDAAAKAIDSFVVEDVLPQLDYTKACVRFVNAISNSQPMALYIKDTVTGNETKVGAEAAYKSAGSFVCFNPGSFDLSTRVAGSATNAIARTGVGFERGRVYTIAARGDMTVTSPTAATRPFLDNTANR
jgi:hypothetical protein